MPRARGGSIGAWTCPCSRPRCPCSRSPSPGSLTRRRRGRARVRAKWDGFRAIVYRDGDEVRLDSRSAKPMERYFPDVVEAVLDALPERCVVDGEIVLAQDGGSTSRRSSSGSTRGLARRPARAGDAGQPRGLRPARAGDQDVTAEPLGRRQELLAGWDSTGRAST
ncbi:hypothetical protein NKG05_27490 [Oerskovia sp. M15]